MAEGLVGGEGFAVDASMIAADAHRRRGVAEAGDLDPTSSRAVSEYLSVLDDAAFGAATPLEPKAISPTDPAARYTAAGDGPAVYAVKTLPTVTPVRARQIPLIYGVNRRSGRGHPSRAN